MMMLGRNIMEVYLDNSATTKPYKEVAEAVFNKMIDFYGNPSSIHNLGTAAKKKLESSRENLAILLGVSSEELIFTSGGSESNNLLIKGSVSPCGHIITTQIEHSSVLNTCRELEKRGVEVTYLEVDNKGRVKLEMLVEAIKENTELVSIMHVNNEIGTIQDLKTIGNCIKKINPNILFHVDAVQSFGKFYIDIKECKIDLLSVSAHKIHGPKGIGAAYIRQGVSVRPQILGGDQEFGFRSGTESLGNVVGFSIAASKMYKHLEDNYAKVQALKEYFVEEASQIQGVKVISTCDEWSSPYIFSIAVTGIRSGKILFFLNDRKIYVSKGSACSARKLKDSYVLKAISLPQEDIMGSLRISFSEENTIAELQYVIECFKECLVSLRSEEHE
jgi:cysteine desulfurase